MAQNFFSFSLHERTQDAFVAWLCSCYNEPVSSVKHIVAEEFIKDLLLGVKRSGVIVNFQSVEVETQIYDIDILLTLKNVNHSGNDYYVVIEDKINSQIHNNQLVRYIRNLIKKKKTSEDHIYVVYYKTGHVANTPDRIKLVNRVTCHYVFDPNVKSEYDEVMSVTTTYPHLAGMNICYFKDIYDFFCSNPLISRCGCFILDDYADHIDAEYKQYNSGVIDAENGRTESQWGRIFDEFINNNKSKYPDLLFKLAFTGSYWEIYVTKTPAGSGVRTCTDPILNVRSTIFEGKHPKPKIYFFVFSGLTTSPALKENKKSATYDIPTDKTTFYHRTLTSSNYKQPMIRREHIDALLDAICEEYNRVCNSGFKGFSLS